MAKRNRETLKNYFKQGKRPSEQEFEDLIDSTMNTLDDGFLGSPQIGIGLTPLADEGVIISAFRNQGDSKPVWKIAVDKNTSDLQIKQCESEQSNPILTLKHSADQALGTHEVIINGIVNSRGRKGCFKIGYIPADGKWYDILGKEDRLEPGCWAFEVVAGCGERNKGRYALMVATAIHCFGKRPKIHTVQSFFGMWGNRIKLRWVKNKDSYDASLQIKTHFRYSDEVYIQYQIANLWDNPQMQL